MTTLNKYAAELARRYEVHACTDVTGFGFLGHLNEMLGGQSGAVIDSMQIPYIREAVHYAKEFYITAAAQRNRNHVGARVRFQGVPFAMEEILFDPQTSGGLLISLSREEAGELIVQLEELGLPCGIVGTVTGRHGNEILVR